MPDFHFGKVDHYKKSTSNLNDVIDIQFPSELKSEAQKELSIKNELLFFVVDDNPMFMQLMNTYLSKFEVPSFQNNVVKIKNYATGRSCIKDLNLRPDIIFLNHEINKELPNALTGSEIIEAVMNANTNQKVISMNDVAENLRNTYVENGLCDYLIYNEDGVKKMNTLIEESLLQAKNFLID